MFILPGVIFLFLVTTWEIYPYLQHFLTHVKSYLVLLEEKEEPVKKLYLYKTFLAYPIVTLKNKNKNISIN